MQKRIMGAEWKKDVNTDKWLVTGYKSLGALLRHLEKNKNTYTNEDSSQESDGSMWSGVKTFDEALDILRDGSDDIKKGLKKSVKLAIEKLNRELNTQPEGFIADVEGLFFDVARVIEGEPECWYREPWDKVKKPRLQIPIMGSYNANFDAETAIKHASEIIALVKALETAGFECEMTMIFMAENCTLDREKMYHSIMIKNYDESFNWNKLSAMLHPSFFRRVIFRDKELLAPMNLQSGYGRTAKPSDFIKNGSTMLNIADHSSIERFKTNVVYQLKGK